MPAVEIFSFFALERFTFPQQLMVLQQLLSLLLTLPFLQPIINKSKLSVCNIVVAAAADATTFSSASAAFVSQPQIKLPINSICVLLLAILQFKPINSASTTTFYLSQNVDGDVVVVAVSSSNSLEYSFEQSFLRK